MNNGNKRQYKMHSIKRTQNLQIIQENLNSDSTIRMFIFLLNKCFNSTRDIY